MEESIKFGIGTYNTSQKLKKVSLTPSLKKNIIRFASKIRIIERKMFRIIASTDRTTRKVSTQQRNI